MIANLGNSLIDRLCKKQEVCWECHQVLEAVKDCIILNECGHMIHEGCFRKMQDNKNFSCKSCKAKINMTYILNQIQVVQITSDGQHVTRHRKIEFEEKINNYFFRKIEMLESLQEQLEEKDKEISLLKEKIKLLENNTDYEIQQLPQESNSSTNSFSFQNTGNPPFPEQNPLLNTVKVKDKLKFYTDLAGLSPQQNIFARETQKDEKSAIDFVSQRTNSKASKQMISEENNFIESNPSRQNLKFSFGFRKEVGNESPDRNTIIQVNDDDSAPQQNSSMLRGRIRSVNSQEKSSLSKMQQTRIENNSPYFPSSSFIYESPKKYQQNANSKIEENMKSSVITRLGNSNHSHKTINSGSKLSDSKIREKCTSCSKDRHHSLPSSDSKLFSDSPDRKKRLSSDFRLQTLSQARQKLNFFNLQQVPQQSQSSNNDTKTKKAIPDEGNINIKSLKKQIIKKEPILNSQKLQFDLDQTIIDINESSKSQQNSQSQNSQDSTTIQNVQKITFNKNARRPHPDQNLLNQQNICMKIPKYLNKN